MTTTTIKTVSGEIICRRIEGLINSIYTTNIFIRSNNIVLNKTPYFDISGIDISVQDSHIVNELTSLQNQVRRIIGFGDISITLPVHNKDINLLKAINFCNQWEIIYSLYNKCISGDDISVNSVAHKLQTLRRMSNSMAKNYTNTLLYLNNTNKELTGVQISLNACMNVFRNYFNTKGEVLDVEKKSDIIRNKMKADNETIVRNHLKNNQDTPTTLTTEIIAVNDNTSDKINQNPKHYIIDYTTDITHRQAEGISCAIENRDKSLNEYRTILSALQQDELIFMSVNHYLYTLNNLINYIENVNKFETTMQRQWFNMVYYLDNIHSELISAETPEVVEHEFSEFNNFVTQLKISIEHFVNDDETKVELN